MSARIQLNDLSVVLGTGNRSVEALRDINLTVDENEFLCVMGPSGCGKTTLLNVIAGFVPATTGSATMNNSHIAGPGKDRAVVFQSDAVFPWMTVEQNIAYSGRFTRSSRSERRRAVETYLDLVGLREFRKAWPKELSGGMRKRVDVARAYCSEPEVRSGLPRRGAGEPEGHLDSVGVLNLQRRLDQQNRYRSLSNMSSASIILAVPFRACQPPGPSP